MKKLVERVIEINLEWKCLFNYRLLKQKFIQLTYKSNRVKYGIEMKIIEVIDMIKSYIKLNYGEKELVSQFINRREQEKKSLLEIEKNIKTEIYGYGEGALFYFDNGIVLGKIYVILEVAEVMETVYIHSVDILESLNSKETILKELLKEGELLACKYNATKILLGIRDEEVLKVAENVGLYCTYSAYTMILEDRRIKEEGLGLVKLSINNLGEYIEVYNKSFMDMPHGTYIDEKEAKEYLDKVNDNNGYFMVSVDGVNIGFMNVNIDNNEGFFDIGLCKEYRGQGYGKRLLETAIDFLKKKNVEKICLTVIEKNNVAYEMYKKRGFKVYKKLSSWIEII